MSALVQIIAQPKTGDKPLLEPVLINIYDSIGHLGVNTFPNFRKVVTWHVLDGFAFGTK